VGAKAGLNIGNVMSTTVVRDTQHSEHWKPHHCLRSPAIPNPQKMRPFIGYIRLYVCRGMFVEAYQTPKSLTKAPNCSPKMAKTSSVHISTVFRRGVDYASTSNSRSLPFTSKTLTLTPPSPQIYVPDNNLDFCSIPPPKICNSKKTDSTSLLRSHN